MFQVKSCLRLIGRNKAAISLTQQQFPAFTRSFAEAKAVKKQPKKAKKGTETKKVKGGEEMDKQDEHLHRFIDAIDEVKTLKHDFTEEELAEHHRIGLEYNRQMMIQHNKMNKDLSTKMWLQDEAMNALPKDLLQHALVIDSTPPPPDRPWPIFMTPPIPELNLKDMEEEEPDISTGDIRKDKYTGVNAKESEY